MFLVVLMGKEKLLGLASFIHSFIHIHVGYGHPLTIAFLDSLFFGPVPF